MWVRVFKVDLKDKTKPFTFGHFLLLINSQDTIVCRSTCSVHECTQTFVIVYDVKQRVLLESMDIVNLGDKSMFCPVKHFTLRY